MNNQPNFDPIEEPTDAIDDGLAEGPTCALCEEPGDSFVVEVREQGNGMWLCRRHLARLQGQVESVPELGALFEGALVITEITPAKLGTNADGQGGGA